RAMLKRELYKGETVWNRSKFVKVPGTNRRISRPRPVSEWQRFSAPELAIVPVELWNRVQGRFKSVGRASAGQANRGLLPRSVTSPYLFSGLLKCGLCGSNLIIASGGGKKAKYVCSGYFNRGICSNNLYIRQDELEERLLGKLRAELLQPESIGFATSPKPLRRMGTPSTSSKKLQFVRKRFRGSPTDCFRPPQIQSRLRSTRYDGWSKTASKICKACSASIRPQPNRSCTATWVWCGCTPRWTEKAGITSLRVRGTCWVPTPSHPTCGSARRGVFGWLRGVDLFPSRSLIPRNLLILRWSGMSRKARRATCSFSFHSVFLDHC